VVTEKVEIERLPPFMGLLYHLRAYSAIVLLSPQKSPQTSVPNFSLKSYTSVMSFLTLMTLAPS
jgi:hypothetical protein